MEANSQSGGSPELRAIAKRTRKNQIGTGLTKVTEPQNPLNLPRPNSCKEEMCLALRTLMPCNFQIHPRADLNHPRAFLNALFISSWFLDVRGWSLRIKLLGPLNQQLQLFLLLSILFRQLLQVCLTCQAGLTKWKTVAVMLKTWESDFSCSCFNVRGQSFRVTARPEFPLVSLTHLYQDTQKLKANHFWRTTPMSSCPLASLWHFFSLHPSWPFAVASI